MISEIYVVHAQSDSMISDSALDDIGAHERFQIISVIRFVWPWAISNDRNVLEFAFERYLSAVFFTCLTCPVRKFVENRCGCDRLPVIADWSSHPWSSSGCSWHFQPSSLMIHT